MKTTLSLAAILSLGGFAAVQAQVPAQLPSTVQLPTFSYFTVGTTVSVPDRGSAYLGGVKRASTGMNEFGTPLVPFRNRSFGMERSASNMHVSVTIHDFEAMEEALLGQAASARALQPRGSLAGRRLQPRGGPVAGAAMSVAEAQRARERQGISREEEAMDFFQRGQAAELAGKANVARIFYQMAARRASDDLKAQVLARLDALDRSKQPPRLAQTTP